MKNVTNRTKKTGFLGGLSKPAKIAVIATASVLLAAIVFGIVFTSIDRSYRYDKVDLTQFFKDGRISIDFDGLGTLPIMIATDVSTEDINSQIDKNLQNMSGVDNHKKKEANITTTRFFNDTAYMFYEVYRVKEDDTIGDLLTSNTAYFKADSTTHAAAAGGASVVRLGKNDFNALIEKFMLNHPEFGTKVDRKLDEGTLVSDNPGYTLVLDVKATYTKDDAQKTYISLPNFYYQPATEPADNIKDYYKGNDTVLTDKSAFDSSVKTPDSALIAKVNELAAALTKIGEEKTFEGTYTVDGTNAYSTKITVSLKAMFLAEQEFAVIDLDDGDYEDETFTYKADSKDQKITDGKLQLRLTLESVLSLDKETVTVLAKDKEENGEIIYKTGFTAPTAPTDPEALAAYNEDNAYAKAYMDYVKADLMKTSRGNIEKEKETFLATIKSTLWKEIVEKYSTDAFITSLPEEEFEKNYEATLAYHEATYKQSYTSLYASLEEYILKAVYSERMEEDSVDYTKLSATQQAEKVKAYIEEDLRESMAEKILLFAIAEHYGITVSGAERRAYKRDYRNSLADAYFSYYKQIYASMMSQGEIRIMADDQAKSEANSYTKTYYRECVYLRKVQETVVPSLDGYDTSLITWVLEDDPALED